MLDLSAAYDLPRLRSSIKPFRLHYFPRLRSTNDHAIALRKRHALFAPALVLTNHQTAGRGRGANRWFATPGCLTVTFVLPLEEGLLPHQLPLIAGLAVRHAVADLTGQPVQLKWPNDIVCAGKKLGGLLCERIARADLIGLGLNVNLDPAHAPRHLRRTLTSLWALTAIDHDLTTVLITVTRHIHQTLLRRRRQSFNAFLQEYDRHHCLLRQPINVRLSPHQPPLTGMCEGLDHLGRLLVRANNTLHRLTNGTVIL